VELADRSIEIVADRGIAAHVASAQWKSISDAMREHFRAGRYEDGTVEAIAQVADLLRAHFPLADSARNPNELSNRPALL
jgi:uncharacterized membrane protein